MYKFSSKDKEILDHIICSKYLLNIEIPCTYEKLFKGEILNAVEGWLSEPIDDLVYLPAQYTTYDLHPVTAISNSVKNHLMGAVIWGLKEAGYE